MLRWLFFGLTMLNDIGTIISDMEIIAASKGFSF
jgi:hypothetical protein